VIYLLDTSALVRLLSSEKLQQAWYDAIDAAAIGSCFAQRIEFLFSARDRTEYDEIAEMYSDLFPDVAVPKRADRWVEVAQYRMSRAGEHRSASAIDLIIAATAALHGLIVLHDDNDFTTVARHAPELGQHNIHDVT
jgi:predicted nucleic acid-binding protein